MDNVRNEQWGLAAGLLMDLAWVLGSESSSETWQAPRGHRKNPPGAGPRPLGRITQICPHPTGLQPSWSSPLAGWFKSNSSPCSVSHVAWRAASRLIHCPVLMYPLIYPPNISGWVHLMLCTSCFNSSMKDPLDHFSSWLTFVSPSRLNYGVTLWWLCRRCWAGWAAPPWQSQISCLSAYLVSIAVCLPAMLPHHMCSKTVTWNECQSGCPRAFACFGLLPLHLLQSFSSFRCYFKQSRLGEILTEPPNSILKTLCSSLSKQFQTTTNYPFPHICLSPGFSYFSE